MSIFDKEIVNNVPMRDRFDISSLSYDEDCSKSISTHGDPLKMLVDKNLEFPTELAHIYEETRWLNIQKAYANQPNMPWIDFQYYYAPSGFECTCEGDRVRIDRDGEDGILKCEYQYALLWYQDIPFIEALIRGGIRYSKVDNLYTLRNYVAALGDEIPWDYVPSNYRHDKMYHYWEGICDTMKETMEKMINPKYSVSISYSVNRSCRGRSVDVWFHFAFQGIDNKQCFWWYRDRKQYKSLMSKSPAVDWMVPSFDAYFALKEK